MNEPIRLTPRLCKAARALLEWQQQDLAKASGVPKPTVSAFEARGGDAKLMGMNNRAAVEAFERAGVQFIHENGGGAGVRLKRRGHTGPISIAAGDLNAQNDV
jgi:DNA-binding XRE family transcriptional regulator